ncbi:major facilitator superfamily MFS_1 [Beutenbergia cavernae DSM 12333]|uniref:Major facilitator superfamily MFS_1 n=2 Tax=Beutenbergia TaxID=84756 RepID=C5BWH7_BEUC1|nr:major facilitator superfamily MFS_1 [Beutenbergia cavernae DSM 12333]
MMRTVPNPYAQILRKPGALQFSSAGVLARFPMSMVGIGIVLMISELYDSYGLAGQVSAVYVVAQALCSPQLARLVDRHGQARVMRPALAVSMIGLVGLILAATSHAGAPLLFALAIVTGATIGSLGSLVRTRWNAVVTNPRELHTAYSLESALDEFVFVIGPVLATILATSVSPSAGLVVAIVAALVGGYWFLSLRKTEPAPSPPDAGTPRTSVLRDGAIVSICIVFVCIGAIFGATDVSVVAFAEEEGQKGLAGVILGICASGSLISGLLYGARHWRSSLWRRFAIGVVALALGVSLFFLVTSLWVLAAVMFVVGFSIAPTLVNGNALVQQIVPPARLTEGLTWIGTSLGVGVSFGSSIAGPIIDANGARAGFLVVVASAALALAAMGTALASRRRRDAVVPTIPDPAADPAS